MMLVHSKLSMMTRKKSGFTAIEVMVSTLLASLLMVAMLGILRGLKAQQNALNTKNITHSWETNLDTILQADLENSRSYQSAPRKLVLRGYAGRDPTSKTANWLPSTIVYEIVHDGKRGWLVRYEPSRGVVSASSSVPELVLADVTALRAGVLGESATAPATLTLSETPIIDNLTVEFWAGESGGPIYAYRFRRP